jgi:hypothetical protein
MQKQLNLKTTWKLIGNSLEWNANQKDSNFQTDFEETIVPILIKSSLLTNLMNIFPMLDLN